MRFALKNPESRMNLSNGKVVSSGDVLTQAEYDAIVTYQGYDEKQKPVTLVNEALAAQFKEVPEEKASGKKSDQASA